VKPQHVFTRGNRDWEKANRPNSVAQQLREIEREIERETKRASEIREAE
jgi:hypothetical protein